MRIAHLFPALGLSYRFWHEIQTISQIKIIFMCAMQARAYNACTFFCLFVIQIFDLANGIFRINPHPKWNEYHSRVLYGRSN